MKIYLHALNACVIACALTACWTPRDSGRRPSTGGYEQLAPNPFQRATPPRVLAVVPTGWILRYADDDHHVGTHSLRLKTLNTSADSIDWVTRVQLRDEKHDDKYEWQVNYAVIGLRDAFVQAPTNAERAWDSDSYLNYWSFSSFETATVVFTGWDLHYNRYPSEDHHVKTIGARLPDVRYFSDDTSIRWSEDCELQDNSGNTLEGGSHLSPLVIACNKGGVAHESFGGYSDGGNTWDNTWIQRDALKGYQHAVVMLRGWNFNFDEGDHHIKRTKVWIDNQRYSPEEGIVSWRVSLNFADHNGDDPYHWTYDVSVLAFDGDLAEIVGPLNKASGEEDEEHYFRSVDDLGWDP